MICAVLHLPTGQRFCTPDTRHCVFSSKQRPLLFHRISGQWAPNSPECPDLNPVDYKIWGVVQQQVHQPEVHDIEELKQRLLHFWHVMDQSIIDKTIDDWDGRLPACVRAKGEHFKPLNNC